MWAPRGGRPPVAAGAAIDLAGSTRRGTVSEIIGKSLCECECVRQFMSVFFVRVGVCMCVLACALQLICVVDV